MFVNPSIQMKRLLTLLGPDVILAAPVIVQASLNVRKGNKLLAIYDLKLTLAWEGQLAGSEEMVRGVKEVVRLHRRWEWTRAARRQ